MYTSHLKALTRHQKIAFSFSSFNFSSIFQPAREARRLARRAERSRRDLSALWASWRASPQAVTSKWHFRTPSPINTNSLAGETDFRQQKGRSRAVYELIQKIPRGETTEILVPLQALIQFFPLMAPNGPFWPFFGPQGAEMDRPLFTTHLEGATRRLSRVHPGYPFPI